MIRHSRIFAVTLGFLGLGLLTPHVATAAPGVGLGAAFGLSAPHGDTTHPTNFTWGFFTDIPLATSFHLSPSTLVYKLGDGSGGHSSTDISMNFKFVLPLSPLSLFGGFTAGVTSTQNLDPHVGLLAGLSFSIVSSLEAFAQANYRVILEGNSNIRHLQIVLGPLFRFQ